MPFVNLFSCSFDIFEDVQCLQMDYDVWVLEFDEYRCDKVSLSSFWWIQEQPSMSVGLTTSHTLR